MKPNLLIDEPPLQVLPSLAVLLGLEEAIALQQLHYWLTNPKVEGRVDENGVKWVFNTYEEWKETNFPFWSEDKIQRVFLSLEKEGVVISAQLDAKKHDMRKFYRIDYDMLCALHDANLRPSNTAKTPPSNTAKLRDDNKELTETTPETTTPRVPQVHDLEVQDIHQTISLTSPGVDKITEMLQQIAIRAQAGEVDVSDYPETVSPMLGEFCKLYHFHPPAMSYKQGSRGSYWIVGTLDLIDACAEFGVDCLRRQRREFEEHMASHNGLPPFEVSSPKSVVNACAAVAAKMRTDRETKPIVYGLKEEET